MSHLNSSVRHTARCCEKKVCRQAAPLSCSDFVFKKALVVMHLSIFKIKHPVEKPSHEERCFQLHNQRARFRSSCHTSLAHNTPIRDNPAVAAAKLLCVLARVTLSHLFALLAVWLKAREKLALIHLSIPPPPAGPRRDNERQRSTDTHP